MWPGIAWSDRPDPGGTRVGCGGWFTCWELLVWSGETWQPVRAGKFEVVARWQALRSEWHRWQPPVRDLARVVLAMHAESPDPAVDGLGGGAGIERHGHLVERKKGPTALPREGPIGRARLPGSMFACDERHG